MKAGLILPMGQLAPSVPQTYADIREMAVGAEDAGLDSLWVFDHMLFDPEKPEESPWEAWTLITALAEATSRVRLGGLVFCTSFRNAAVTARMADTLQEISDNRLILGLGCGWHKPEYDAFGIPFVGRVDGFDEALQIITGMLRQGRATVPGRHHSAVDAPVRLRDGRQPPEILVAAKGPRMLGLTARYADSWNLAWFGQPSDRWQEHMTLLDEACAAADRDPKTLRRTVGVTVSVEPAEPTDGYRPISSDPAAIAEALHAWSEAGADEVIVNLEPVTPAGADLVVAGVAAYRG